MLVRVEADLQPVAERWVEYQDVLRHANELFRTVTLDVAGVLSAMAAPGAGIMYTLGVWRLACDLDWAGSFAITSGLFSHWQVWLMLGAATQFLGVHLGRWSTHRPVTE